MVVQLHADLQDAHCGVHGQGLSNPTAVGMNHYKTQRLHMEKRRGVILTQANVLIIYNDPVSCGQRQREMLCVKLFFLKRCYHDHFDSLGHRVWFVVLLFLHHSGEVVQLPDRMSLLTLSGQLSTNTTHTHTFILYSCPLREQHK